jgi:hypothetical protein
MMAFLGLNSRVWFNAGITGVITCLSSLLASQGGIEKAGVSAILSAVFAGVLSACIEFKRDLNEPPQTPGANAGKKGQAKVLPTIPIFGYV